ncbi:MAG: LysR family transcriptional regulator [Pseudomonadota bacterium]|jgi:DNA-binding transcriptional LysR family regulator
MQIDLLDTFLDLVETRSFNRTGERLGITQSTVSGRIAALEAALGVRLFSRSRAGTDLTPEGARFEGHARALRHGWNEAARRIRVPGGAGDTVKLGIQNDLAARHIGEWMAEFRRALPDTVFYVEPDYSAQMCADLVTGAQDFAVMFTPKAHPDLHFTSVGEVTYRLISSTTNRRADLVLDSYVFAHFSPAFEAMHRELLPELAAAPVSVGQSATVASLLAAMGGAGYVLDRTAEGMIASGRFMAVDDAPVLRQPVYAATHLRHRIAPLHRRLLRIVQRRLAGR